MVDSALLFDVLPNGEISGASFAQFGVAPNPQGVRNVMRGTTLKGRVTAVRDRSVDLVFHITPGDSPSNPTLTSHLTLFLDKQFIRGKTSSTSKDPKRTNSYRWIAVREH
jgi:hypothetical protein